MPNETQLRQIVYGLASDNTTRNMSKFLVCELTNRTDQAQRKWLPVSLGLPVPQNYKIVALVERAGITIEITFDPKLGWHAQQSMKRPVGFLQMSPEERWIIDRNLGILDWSGDPSE